MKIVLEQKQMLKMVMTTELRQAIELLQLSTYDLHQFIREQAEENPLIELIEKDDSPSIYESKRKNASDSTFDPMTIVADKETSLYEHLLEQTIAYPLSENENAILRYLILNIDAKGFLTVEDEEVCNHFGVSLSEVENIRQLLKQLEPVGIGARNVKECLLIQAEKYYPEDELICTMIDQYLEPLANKQWGKIADELDVTLQVVKEVYEKIQTFHPRPAANFTVETNRYVEPDIIIEAHTDKDTFIIQLNERYLPDIQFNHIYSEYGKNEEIAQFVKTCYQKYEWLKNSIEQRRETILKIMEVIVQRQSSFLVEGFRSLKPLTMKEVADEIGMHESTVSRATANKIVQTPVGTYELKQLFSTKLATSTGSDTSQAKVKLLIQQIIDEEDKKRPLSDQKIANILKEENGIKISRRTVAKYRDELHIPSSSRRKEI